MKRKISLLLCIVMMLSAVSLFSSCSKSGSEPKVSKKTVEIDLNEYTVVQATDLTVNAKTQVSMFTSSLKTLTSLKIKASNDAETASVSTEDKEILIGKTFRTETDKVLKSLGDCGWGIRVFDNKIVIVGTNSFMTRAALSYFTENYLNGGAVNGSKITVNKQVSFAKVDMISLVSEVEDGDGELYTDGVFKIVYSDDVDDEAQAKEFGGERGDPQGGDKTDYTYDFCCTFATSLRRATELGSGAFKLATDATENEYEFLVGKVDREDYMTELRKIEANQYGVTVKNGKVMVLAWNDAILEDSQNLLDDLINECAVEDKKGNITYMIPASVSVVETSGESFYVDFPKPDGDGIELHGTVDVSDGCMEYIYTGTGVSRESYVAYCEKLEADGYAMLGNENQNCGNSFRQYLNNATGSTLYVYHSPYDYMTEQGVTDTLPSLRIIAGSTDSVNLPDTEMLSQKSYTKTNETMITALPFDYDSDMFGMSYIYTLEDGTFLVFDGGIGNGTWDDCTYIYGELQKLYKMTHGQDPDTNNPIRIRAWLLTHEHGDHFGVLKQFFNKYCGNGKDVKVERLLFNASSPSEGYNTTNPDTTVKKIIPDMFTRYGIEYIKVHTGQVFYFANAKIEILYTHEDIYPRKVQYFNNTGTVFKITTSAQGSTDSTVGIWLGDIERIGSRRLRAMWSTDMLKADMVQQAHHGCNGCEAALYDIISATVLWFPQSAKNINSWSKSETSNTWWMEVDYHSTHKVSSVKIIITSDYYNTTMILKDGKVPEDLTVYNLKQITYDDLSNNVTENLKLFNDDSKIDPHKVSADETGAFGEHYVIVKEG